jgi:DNA-directed RNA polymerase specialized sigma24 family protein
VKAGTPDSELLDRLEDALARLPSAERAAVMTAYGYGEGAEAVAADLGLADVDAEALSRNALQLLRGALADAEPDERTRYPRLKPRGTRSNTKAPD